MFSLTIWRSKGLSSRKTIESKPMFRILWIVRILSTFVSQLAIKTAMSSSLSTISGCFSKGSLAVSSLFFETTQVMTPLCLSFLIHIWNSVKAFPIPNPCPSWIPSIPSSPITPPQMVLSRSIIKHFLNCPFMAQIISKMRPATYGSESRLSTTSVLT